MIGKQNPTKYVPIADDWFHMISSWFFHPIGIKKSGYQPKLMTTTKLGISDSKKLAKNDQPLPGIPNCLVEVPKWHPVILSDNDPHTIHGTGIFTYIWLNFMVNVGRYTSPMDASWVMGHGVSFLTSKICSSSTILRLGFAGKTHFLIPENDGPWKR